MGYTAYLSSTLNDLQDERQAVREALSDQCVVSHSYGASEKEVVESCLNDVDRSDLYILILGLRYGYVPNRADNPEKLSITELEYQRAKDKPRYVFIKKEESIAYPLTDAKTKEHAAERIEGFRKRAADEQRPAMFGTADELKLAVVKAFNAFKNERERRARRDAAAVEDVHARALRLDVSRDGSLLRVSALNQGTHVIRDIEINAIPDDEDWYERTHGPLPRLVEGGGRGIDVTYPILGGWFHATVAQLSPNRGWTVATFEMKSTDYTVIDFDVFWNDHTGQQRKAHAVGDVRTLHGDLALKPRPEPPATRYGTQSR
jgi:hypothetical protein